MIVLGIDASGWGASAAVVDEDGVRGAASAGRGARPAAILVPMVAAALASAGLPRGAVEGVAVANGPGSYAGVRAAVATAKGLAWALGLPVAAVGSLRALACAAGPWPGPVWAAWDARRDRVYAAGHRWGASGPEERAGEEPALRERVPFRAALRDATAAGGPCLLVGTGVGEDDLAIAGGGRLAPPVWGAGLAAAVGWLGWQELRAGRGADAMALAPAYGSDPVLGRAPGEARGGARTPGGPA